MNYYEMNLANNEFGSCSDCNQEKTDDKWCRNCNSKCFQQDFNKWDSGNEQINKFIQDAQKNARNHKEVLEWIPYYKFKNVKYLDKGGFSTVYKAIWLDGYITKLSNNKQGWERKKYKLENVNYENVKSPLKENEKFGIRVALKSLNDSSDIHENFLNEWKIHLRFLYSAVNNYTNFVKIYGITQDPETSNYMIVLQEMQMGNLRSNLMIKKFNPNDKYHNLYEIAISLSALHKCDLVHGDFHSGNILLKDEFRIYISDFGLSRPASKPTSGNESYGVLPYIAPEVLRGKQYTKAADIYSFGIIMWEFTSGVPAFNNVPHDLNFCLKVCGGYRPTIIKGTDPNYAKLMKECWDSDPNKRPMAEKLAEIFDVWSTKYLMEMDNKERIQVPDNINITVNHPMSCYISRRIDDLSSRIVVDEEKDNSDLTLLSESLV